MSMCELPMLSLAISMWELRLRMTLALRRFVLTCNEVQVYTQSRVRYVHTVKEEISLINKEIKILTR